MKDSAINELMQSINEAHVRSKDLVTHCTDLLFRALRGLEARSITYVDEGVRAELTYPLDNKDYEIVIRRIRKKEDS